MCYLLNFVVIFFFWVLVYYFFCFWVEICRVASSCSGDICELVNCMF